METALIQLYQYFFFEFSLFTFFSTSPHATAAAAVTAWDSCRRTMPTIFTFFSTSPHASAAAAVTVAAAVNACDSAYSMLHLSRHDTTAADATALQDWISKSSARKSSGKRQQGPQHTTVAAAVTARHSSCRCYHLRQLPQHATAKFSLFLAHHRDSCTAA